MSVAQKAALTELDQFCKATKPQEKADDIAAPARRIGKKISEAGFDAETAGTHLAKLEEARVKAHMASLRDLFDKYKTLPVSHGAAAFEITRGQMEDHAKAIDKPLAKALAGDNPTMEAVIPAILNKRLEEAAFVSANKKYGEYIKLTDKNDTSTYNELYRDINKYLGTARKTVADLGENVTADTLAQPRKDAHQRAGESSLNDMMTTRREYSVERIKLIAESIKGHFDISGDNRQAELAVAVRNAHKNGVDEGLSRLGQMRYKTAASVFNRVAERVSEHLGPSVEGLNTVEAGKRINDVKQRIREQSDRVKGRQFSFGGEWDLGDARELLGEIKPAPRREQKAEVTPIPWNKPLPELDTSPAGKGKGGNLTSSDKKTQQPKRKP